MNFSAVLWDMDGTLVDTEPYWMQAEIELMAKHGLEWTHEQGKLMVGNELLTSAQILIDHGLALPAEQIVDLLLERVVELVKVRIPWRPGARELLTDLAHHRVPCALVTMSYRVLAQAVVDGLPPGTFVGLITGDEVTYGKPHPEPYVRGAELLGVPPDACIALEDSVPGLTSAVAAGTIAIGIVHLVDLPQGRDHILLESLEGQSVDSLRALVDSDR